MRFGAALPEGPRIWKTARGLLINTGMSMRRIQGAPPFFLGTREAGESPHVGISPSRKLMRRFPPVGFVLFVLILVYGQVGEKLLVKFSEYPERQNSSGDRIKAHWKESSSSIKRSRSCIARSRRFSLRSFSIASSIRSHDGDPSVLTMSMTSAGKPICIDLTFPSFVRG